MLAFAMIDQAFILASLVLVTLGGITFTIKQGKLMRG